VALANCQRVRRAFLIDMVAGSTTMWSLGGRRDDQVSPHREQTKMPSFLRKGKKGKPGAKGGNNGGSSAGAVNLEEMNVNETNSGIEVSLDAVYKEESRDPAHSRMEPVISLKKQIMQRQRVHKAQFSVSFPALDSKGDASMDKWRPQDHRIPLLGVSRAEPAYEDVLSLLQNSQVSTEYGALSQELTLMTAEIDALEKDRNRLETSLTKMSNSSTSFAAGKTGGDSVDWDVRKVLDANGLVSQDRKKLQAKRGNCLTLSLQSSKAKENFLSRCGAKLGQLNSNKRRAPGDTVTLTPTNCKPGGAAVGMRHVSLMSSENGSHSSFFFSRDTGKSQTWGRLSAKLFRRIKQAGSAGHEISDIVYVSTGPHGCYYAEFRSGEIWWGNAVEDNDFHAILEQWDVYRVVFGPIEVFEDEHGNSRVANSWIILGRDGRAAWKNLPSRLQHQLESRLANWAAPAEVSLGPGDSYFIRFLDGTVDYCLPAEVAQVCDHIERYGGSITEIALHPEISHDFLIRHTEMR
jgi:hypothetical protein